MRVLAVDHGARRIGLAISDPTGTLARPLTVFLHTSRPVDAARVNDAALEHGAGLIVVGQSLDEDGRPNAAGRRARRFAEALQSQTAIAVLLWDESMSTQDAKAPSLGSEAMSASSRATAAASATVKPRTTPSRRISLARGE